MKLLWEFSNSRTFLVSFPRICSCNVIITQSFTLTTALSIFLKVFMWQCFRYTFIKNNKSEHAATTTICSLRSQSQFETSYRSARQEMYCRAFSLDCVRLHRWKPQWMFLQLWMFSAAGLFCHCCSKLMTKNETGFFNVDLSAKQAFLLGWLNIGVVHAVHCKA